MTGEITLRCNATALAVRHMLDTLRAHLLNEPLPDDVCGNIEIAMAEALNNIVEHAYYPGSAGTIMLTVRIGPSRVSCEVRDHGVALPGLGPLSGLPPDVSGLRASLPEGGFGWSLIHALTARLCYLRDGAENRLVLDFDRGTR